MKKEIIDFLVNVTPFILSTGERRRPHLNAVELTRMIISAVVIGGGVLWMLDSRLTKLELQVHWQELRANSRLDRMEEVQNKLQSELLHRAAKP